jgi:hypothetical protein
VNARQTCLAHLIRTARGLAARPHPELAAFGAWALVELQRVCQMAKAPPTGGEWRAWYGPGWCRQQLLPRAAARFRLAPVDLSALTF